MTSQPNINRLILLLGGSPDLVKLSPNQLAEYQWLDKSLERWIDSPADLFQIALEKEEKDTYRKAVEAHLLDADEIAAVDERQIEGYRRPGVMRQALQSMKDFDPQELPNLKKSRKVLRALLEKRTKRLESKREKLQVLKQKIEEQKVGLAELNPVSDNLISKCAGDCIDLLSPLSSDLDNTERDSALFKDITSILKNHYQDLSKLSIKVVGSRAEAESLDQQFSILNRAVENVEEALYQEELQKILEELESGSTLQSLAAQEETVTSTSDVLASALRFAWQRDEFERISYQEAILLQSKQLLESRIAPPVILLYEGLSLLQKYVIEAHAQCDALIIELANYAESLLSEVEGSEISEE